MIKDYKDKIMIPYEKDFIQDKEISDRVYSWILLTGRVESNSRVSISTNLRGAYIDLGINYRTFHRKINYLLRKGFIKKYIDYNGEERYITIGSNLYYHKAYISKDVLEKLYNAKKNNIIKVYITLMVLKENEKNHPYFKLDTLAREINYNMSGVPSSSINHKMEDLIKILRDLGLISYEEQSIRLLGQKSKQTNYLLTEIKGGSEIKEGHTIKLKDLPGVAEYLGNGNEEINFLCSNWFLTINSDMDCEYIGSRKDCKILFDEDEPNNTVFAKISARVSGGGISSETSFILIFIQYNGDGIIKGTEAVIVNATENNVRVCNDYIENNKSDYELE